MPSRYGKGPYKVFLAGATKTQLSDQPEALVGSANKPKTQASRVIKPAWLDKGKLSMKDQVILITGALTGIGRATALAAAGEGYNIVVSGRNAQTGAALEADLLA